MRCGFHSHSVYLSNCPLSWSLSNLYASSGHRTTVCISIYHRTPSRSSSASSLSASSPASWQTLTNSDKGSVSDKRASDMGNYCCLPGIVGRLVVGSDQPRCLDDKKTDMRRPLIRCVRFLRSVMDTANVCSVFVCDWVCVFFGTNEHALFQLITRSARRYNFRCANPPCANNCHVCATVARNSYRICQYD